MSLAKRILGDASFACWEFGLSLLKLLFHYLLKTMGSQTHVQRQEIAHQCIQGHVWIPGLYGDAQPGLLYCWKGRVWASPLHLSSSKHHGTLCGICIADGQKSLLTGSFSWVPSTLTALGLCHKISAFSSTTAVK